MVEGGSHEEGLPGAPWAPWLQQAERLCERGGHRARATASGPGPGVSCAVPSLQACPPYKVLTEGDLLLGLSETLGASEPKQMGFAPVTTGSSWNQ